MKRHSAPSMATLSLLGLLYSSQPLNGQATNVFPSSGNVGIGTVSPVDKLNVANGSIFLDNNGNYSALALRTGQNNSSGNYSANIILATGGCTISSPCEMNTAYGHYFGMVSFRSTANLGSSLGGMLATIPQSHTASSRPMSLSFLTTPIGTTQPQAVLYLDASGNVGIGTISPQYKLAVNGSIAAKDIIVTNTGWPDYVFRPGYRLQSLSEVSAYIQKHQHLPDIPTEAEVKEKGVSVSEMQAKLLAKIEELTLHVIQQHKENSELRERIAHLETRAATNSAPMGR